MSRKTIRFGVRIGLLGGSVMALFAMTAMWATGHGFFTIVNSFAHTFWKDAPTDGTFTLASFELGLVIHLVVSMLIGTVIAWLAERGHLDAGTVIALGVVVGAAVWAVQAVAWAAVDPTAHSMFTPWILASAHLVFALGAAITLMWLQNHDPASAETPEMPAAATEPVSVTIPRATRSGFTRSFDSRQSVLD